MTPYSNPFDLWMELFVWWDLLVRQTMLLYSVQHGPKLERKLGGHCDNVSCLSTTICMKGEPHSPLDWRGRRVPLLGCFVGFMSFLESMSGQLMIVMGFYKWHPLPKVLEVNYYSPSASNGSSMSFLVGLTFVAIFDSCLAQHVLIIRFGFHHTIYSHCLLPS